MQFGGCDVAVAVWTRWIEGGAEILGVGGEDIDDDLTPDDGCDVSDCIDEVSQGRDGPERRGEEGKEIYNMRKVIRGKENETK